MVFFFFFSSYRKLIHPFRYSVTVKSGEEQIYSSETHVGTTIDDSLIDTTLNSTYVWTVSEPICGFEFTSTFSTLSNLKCFQYFAEDLPQNIVAYGTINSNLTVDQTYGSMVSIALVDVTGVHRGMDDLTFTLISPHGSSVEIYSEDCYTDDDFNWLRIEDGRSNEIDCPGGGYYRPNHPLSPLLQFDPVGIWTLSIENSWARDGPLNSWGLELCYSEEEFQYSCNDDIPTVPETSFPTNTETNTCTCSTVITSEDTMSTDSTQSSEPTSDNVESFAEFHSPFNWIQMVMLMCGFQYFFQ